MLRRRRSRPSLRALIAAACTGFFAVPASAHPHVFVTASVQFVGNDSDHLTAIRTAWVFDEVFSSSLLFDFDANGDGTLDEGELNAVAGTVLGSAKEYDFFTFLKSAGVTNAGTALALSPPDHFSARFEQGHLAILTQMRPEKPVPLAAAELTLSIYDPSYYVSFDVASKEQVKLTGLPAACRATLDSTHPSEGATAWMNQVAGLGKSQSIPADGINYAELLSTRVALDCR
ncbi:DUF1007 family protein [Aurantimonas sp. 22II-16-19i]|uniref:DUF1007 family protein n=1 Tax=Aurantimonas sp. 22II-16-19i TaxID=1317114 RepID=UPI0015945500|nr:DUF1007 family protein [Aurantimonas sp. 22II-16-19i]